MTNWHVALLITACLFASADKEMRKTAITYVFLMFFCEWLVHKFTQDQVFYLVAGLSDICISAVMLSFKDRAARWIAIASMCNAVVWFGYYTAYYIKSFIVFEYLFMLPVFGEYSQILAIIVFSKPIFSRIYTAEHQHKQDRKKKDAALWLETWNYL